jgi:hypothetical protein
MDATPTALFDSYEQDFKHIIRSISDKLEGNGKDQLGGMCCYSYSYHNLTVSGKNNAKPLYAK